jgi:hypothetical protein
MKGKIAMTPTAKIPVQFAPMSEQTAWTQPISANDEFANGARFSARFTVKAMETTENATARNLSPRSGVNAARQVPRRPFWRRRLFHSVHPAPANRIFLS